MERFIRRYLLDKGFSVKSTDNNQFTKDDCVVVFTTNGFIVHRSTPEDPLTITSKEQDFFWLVGVLAYYNMG